MTKDLITPEMLDKAADSATIEQLNTIIKARDIEIAALKAQVNALKDAISEIQVDRIEEYDYRGYSYCNGCDSNLDKQDHSLDCLFKVAKQTPQQCLAGHNEVLIRDFFDKKGIITSVGTLVVDSDDADEFLGGLKK